MVVTPCIGRDCVGPSGERRCASARAPGAAMHQIARTETIIPEQLADEDKVRLTDALYDIHRQVFDGEEKEAFRKYVVDAKAEHTWIQVHKSEAGTLVGYFAMHIFEREFHGETVAVVRAEAGTLRAYRGANANATFGLRHALHYKARHLARKMYYVGLLVHPSSYSVFAKYFDELYPSHKRQTPPDVLDFVCRLAEEFELAQVDAERPLVRHDGWCTRESEVERDYWRYHCEKDSVRYFVEANAGYGEGQGLLTVVPMTARALAHVAGRFVLERVQRLGQSALTFAQRLPLGNRLLHAASVRRRLEASPLFAGFAAQSLDALTASAEVVTLPAGRTLFRQGDVSDDLYLLVRGAAYVLAEQPDGEPKILDEVGGGALLGEIAMLSGEPRSASVRTASAATLVRIRRDALFPLLEMDSSLRRALWSAFAARRFDDCVRDLARFRALGRRDRLQWIARGELQLLASNETTTVSGEAAFVFVLTGAVACERSGTWLVTRAPALLDVKGALVLRAEGASRIVRVPPR